MNETETVLAVIGGIVALTISAAAIWAIWTASTRDAMAKRLQGDNEYLMKQVAFIEPRFRDAEAKNEMLMKLHNPTAKLDAMTELEKNNHLETVRLLGEQHLKLDEIKSRLEGTS